MAVAILGGVEWSGFDPLDVSDGTVYRLNFDTLEALTYADIADVSGVDRVLREENG